MYIYIYICMYIYIYINTHKHYFPEYIVSYSALSGAYRALFKGIQGSFQVTKYTL